MKRIHLTPEQCQLVAQALHFVCNETSFSCEITQEEREQIPLIERAILDTYPLLESKQSPGEVAY